MFNYIESRNKEFAFIVIETIYSFQSQEQCNKIALCIPVQQPLAIIADFWQLSGFGTFLNALAQPFTASLHPLEAPDLQVITTPSNVIPHASLVISAQLQELVTALNRSLLLIGHTPWPRTTTKIP